jgi:hypothetical protein
LSTIRYFFHTTPSIFKFAKIDLQNHHLMLGVCWGTRNNPCDIHVAKQPKMIKPSLTQEAIHDQLR